MNRNSKIFFIIDKYENLWIYNFIFNMLEIKLSIMMIANLKTYLLQKSKIKYPIFCVKSLNNK